jgi:hypothetical protein
VKQEDRGAVSKVCEISMALFTHGTQALFVWLKVLFTDLLREKNTVRWLKKYDL